MNIIGRLLIRKDKIAGLYIPFDTNFEAGLYDVREIMGEIQIVFKGIPAMNPGRLNGLSCDQLIQYPESLMTEEEVITCQVKRTK